ncbi:RagB/SusD family nutrient uptake outer membrane protein [Arenibacter sp. TNZ]|jgi:hypothetical protein|uniref:RagB/SusD family nutrient uptake outer membrane protein n=1 Tax=Arenibacter TaxID=178469 RepID=UPI000CD406C8|nr:MULTISPECIES: RagB/SusD family nutrient uptake outer membrane protein [Arenibacter]MCM4173345.1 RagB/SusD family nutrient uptake outer membrane protein [Arenibacter sp. TNZ]
MKTIRNYIYLLLVLGLVSSCDKDVLEVSSTTQISAETFWKTESDAKLGIDGVYNRLQSYASNYLYTDAVADNAYSNYPWEGFKAIADGTHDARGPGSIDWFWDDFWKGIGRANTLLDNIDAVEMDEAIKTRMKGEALFLRAYFYFQLTDFYGGVPLILEAPKLEHGALPRNTKEAVVDQIIVDLNAAAGMLETTASETGRATEGAAIALKAKVLLFNNRNAEAAVAANEVMGMGYSLFPSYRDLFKEENENNEEVIFDAQFKSPEVGNFYELYIGADGGGGWASIMPLPELVADYDMVDGLPTSTSPLYDPANPYENRDPRLKQTLFVPGSTYNNGVPLNDLNTYTGFAFKKYTEYDEDTNVTPTGYPTTTGLNVIILRYAEILLIYAEAQNEAVGPDASVYAALKELRSRPSVMMPDIPAGLSQAQMREVIRHERRVELAMEGKRYSDVRRWGIAEDVMNGIVDPGGTRTFNPSRDYLWPIPGKQFDLPDNTLEQNPNYGE